MIRTIAAALATTTCLVALATPASAKTREYNVPAGSLRTALDTFARQSGRQVIYRGDVRSARSPGVSGARTAEDALNAILAGSGFVVRTDRSGAFAIVKAGHDQSSAVESLSSTGKATAGSTAANNESAQDIVVTGTNIRGVGASSSPTSLYSRSEIDQSGVGTVAEFIQRLPQNFGGGASEDTVLEVSGGGGVGNVVNGTGINLRGLGNGATLVLLNGNRLAPGNTSGNFVDVSLIPLNAIERVEVVPDGASAVYGSDAVGGVVNFILRKHFSGPETRLRVGTVTHGDSKELQVGQSLGSNWATGSVLLSYEFASRTALDARFRGRSASDVFPLDVLPESKRHSALLSFRQEVGKVEIVADALFGYRHTPYTTSIENGYSQRYDPEIYNYGGNINTFIPISGKISASLTGGYMASSTDLVGKDRIRGSTIQDRLVRADVISGEGKLDGTLIDLPQGPIKFAFGAQYRNEGFWFRNRIQFPSSESNTSRDVVAAFAELNIPLLADSSGKKEDILQVTLANRFEHYSDFGNTNNPKIGFIFRPNSFIKIRGTFGTSFKAPILSHLNPVPDIIYAQNIFDPSVNALRPTVILVGGNPALGPEKAKTWSFGADLLPNDSGLKAQLTYYHVKYDDRIVVPSSIIPMAQALVQESVLGPAIVQRAPNISTLQSLVGNPAFRNIFRVTDPLKAVAILDYRRQNLSAVSTDGIDFGVSYSRTGAQSSFELGVDGTYILSYNTKFSGQAPVQSILNTPYNPIDLRLRGRGLYSWKNVSGSVFVNFTDSYRDKRVGVARSRLNVDSWTTVDVNITYQVPDASPFGALTLTLGTLNVTNARPPFLANPFTKASDGLDFDGANSNILGRFVYLQISKGW